VRSVGVDLAAEAAGTAVAVLDWTGAGALLRELVLPADDHAVLAAVAGADKAGIDCPLGWPGAFVAFVAAHHSGQLPVPPDAGRLWRRGLAWRATDEAVREATGLIPLSVSADRIGHAALRAAALLARIDDAEARSARRPMRPLPSLRGEQEPLAAPLSPAAAGGAVAGGGRSVQPRDGSATVVEVYPAGSLKQWGLPYRGYKRAGNRAVLGGLVDALCAAAPWLDLDGYQDACRRSDHAFDAVVSALTARAAWQATTTRPPAGQAQAARAEGWIALPLRPLEDLLAGAHR
jgi:Protein of unknown function (DUF429)